MQLCRIIIIKPVQPTWPSAMIVSNKVKLIRPLAISKKVLIAIAKDIRINLITILPIFSTDSQCASTKKGTIKSPEHFKKSQSISLESKGNIT